MRIIVCPDSFKGSLSAAEAAEAMKSGVSKAVPNALVELIPLADGGEGTVDALVRATDGKLIVAQASGPLGRHLKAYFGILGDGETAVIEMAAASGLHLLSESERNPLLTTTYGFGELILQAYDLGCSKFILGIGGSATNDGGAGALAALGVRFLDRHGRELECGGAALARLDRINTSGMLIHPDEISVRVACDVDNPLIGPTGASAVYGPQKGATTQMVEELDLALANYARVIEADLGIDVANVPGAGAAGGLGAGLLAFLDARLESGIDIVLDGVRFSERIEKSDLVITGEGRVDEQTAFGKTIMGVLKRARSAGIPVVVLAGSVGEGIEPLYDAGAAAILSIAPGPISLEESMARSAELLTRTAENAVRLFLAGSKEGVRS